MTFSSLPFPLRQHTHESDGATSQSSCQDSGQAYVKFSAHTSSATSAMSLSTTAPWPVKGAEASAGCNLCPSWTAKPLARSLWPQPVKLHHVRTLKTLLKLLHAVTSETLSFTRASGASCFERARCCRAFSFDTLVSRRLFRIPFYTGLVI